MTTTIDGAGNINSVQIALASQAQAEAGTDNATLMTLLRTAEAVAAELNVSGSAPIYACRAWVNFNGTGTVAIRASGNVSSVTDLGVGRYQVNFTTAMPDANYAAVANAVQAITGTMIQYQAGVTDLLTTSCTINTSQNGTSTNVAADCALVSLVIFR